MACANCGRDDRLRRGRCGACSSYFYSTGRERTPDVRRPRHGHAPDGRPSREYACWLAAKARCFSQGAINYADYGGRGITMAPQWAHNFPAFLADIISELGPRPDGMTLDRIDNDGHYEPGNVRWAPRFIQDRNHRRNNWLTHRGETLCVTDWAARLGTSPSVLFSRLHAYGWSIEATLSTPIRPRRRRR